MNNKLLGIAFGGALTLAGLATGCSDANDVSNSAESALKGGNKAADSDAGLSRCSKSKEPKRDGGSKDGDEDTDESDADSDADESAGDGGLGHGKGVSGKPADADKGGGKPADADKAGDKPDGVEHGKSDAGHGKSETAKLNKDKGGKQCMQDDGTVGHEADDDDDDEDQDDDATHGQSGEHGKADNNGKGHGKDVDAGA